MATTPFHKVPLTYDAQLQLLVDRGLIIDNKAKALFLLENISYFRLSGYWFPLLADKPNHVFKTGGTFNAAFQLYCFDKELRKLLLSELEKIEVAVRAKMIYILSHEHGPFWFQNPGLFRNPGKHENLLSKISDEYSRSDEEFIEAFRRNYSDPLPPSWMILEITSFGTLSQLYSLLNPGRNKRDIANHFGLPDTVFSSWLHSIVYLRNVCAHHARLWNRVLSISPQSPHNPRKPWLAQTVISNRRTYYVLCMVKYLLSTVNPSNSLTVKLETLFNKYPSVDFRAMGFTPDWRTESLWKK
jgi:abortive infection bacteriophage resistance protein